MTFLGKVKIIGLLILMCLNATALKAESPADELPPLKGYRTYSDPWRTGQEKYGFCTIPTDGSTGITALTEGRTDLKLSSGGALTNNGYVGFDHKQLPSGQPQQSEWYRFDPVTFEEIESGMLDFFFSVPALAYDAASGLIYCCVADFDTGGFFFASLDPSTMKLTRIADIGDKFWFAMAADGKGTLYAINYDCDLLKINPADGTTTVVGATTVLTYNTGSLAIDPASGRCFWSVTPAATFMGSLYEVDLTTGEAWAVCTFPDADEFTGIYFDIPNEGNMAPGAPQDFKAVFANGLLTGKLIFTVPETLSDGSAPDDDATVTYTISANEGLSWQGTASYGATVERAIEVSQSGDYTFSGQFANDYGTSPLVKCSLWIGLDMPEAIARPKVRLDDKSAIITWEHPLFTVHNHAVVDPSEMEYKVTRLPDNVVVAHTASTTATDSPEVADDDMTPYQYAVTAIFTTGSTTAEAEPVTTSALVFGTAPLPYFNDFADESQMAHFTVIDSDGDGATWSYNTETGAPFATYGDWTAKDDWIISPAFIFESGKHYILSVDVAAMGESNPEAMEIELLSDLSAESSVAGILDRTVVTNSILNGYRTLTARFAAPSSGRMYVGIHAVSDKSSYYLYVDNFSLSAGIDSNAPAAPTDVTVLSAEDGSSSAEITGRAPARTYAGDALSSAVDILVYRDGELIHTSDALAAGSEFKVTDTPEPGRHIYRVQAANSYGAGEALEIPAFVGVSAPKAPEGIVMFENDELPGRVHLGWQAPAEDGAGQPLDQASVRYAIVDLYGNIVAENLAECSYIVDAMPMGVERMFARFAIYAMNEVGVSPEPGYTAMIPVGYPYEGGWKESFADGAISTMIGSAAENITDDVQWAPTADTATLSAADGDNGFAIMRASATGLSADLITPKCTVGEADLLAFAWSGMPDSKNTLQVYAVESQHPQLVGEIALGLASGWQPAQISLDSYRGKDVYFIFRGTAVSDNEICIDGLSVASTSGVDNIAGSVGGMTLTTGKGWLAVSGVDGMPVSVYTIDGREVAVFAAAEGRRIPIGAGVYIVRCGIRSAKAVVK